MGEGYLLSEITAQQGCSDGDCKLRLGPREGQHTNGGCRCLREVPTSLRLQVERKIQFERGRADGNESMVRVVVMNAPSVEAEPGLRKMPTWEKVAFLCGVGREGAIALCRKYQVDPQDRPRS